MICSSCNKNLPIKLFSRNRRARTGRRSECKNCTSSRARRYRLAHKAELAIKLRAYRRQNATRLRLLKRKYYLKHKDYIIKRARKWTCNNNLKCVISGRKTRRKQKITICTHYCDGSPKCKSCLETDIDVLTLDHINDDGAEHRRRLGINSGYHFYCWLRNEHKRLGQYPGGLQVLCFNCQLRKQLKSASHSSVQMKRECLANYGGLRCALCRKKKYIACMTLDHVNDDGSQHRRAGCGTGIRFYRKLKRDGFPQFPALQSICMNCQIKKRYRRDK